MTAYMYKAEMILCGQQTKHKLAKLKVNIQ